MSFFQTSTAVPNFRYPQARLSADQALSTAQSPVGVLFVTDQLLILGGAERALLRIVDRLPRDRFTPHVLTFKLNPSLDIEKSISCPITIFPLERTYDPNALRVACQIRALVRKHKIRITHTFHETSDLWAGPIAKLSGCPILISSRRDMGFARKGKHGFAYRCLGRIFNQVQTVSEEVRRHNICQDRLPAHRVVTIYNGVDIQPRPLALNRIEMRKHFGLSRFGRIVTSVGHLRSVKGFDVFVRAAAQIHQQMNDTGFVIAGEELEPDYASRLKGLAATLGLGDSLVFLGDVSNVRDLLQASDIFCLLSRSEGLSNSILEAMACELPSVVTAVGGNPELIVPGETGFLVESEDAESAAAALVRLLMDSDLARRMGAQALEMVEKDFTTEIMMRRLTESYDRLLGDAVRGNA